MITAVTTCMGRLEHLETTLPLMLQEFDRVIVVDWSCPQNSGEWAAEEGASVVYKKEEKYFNASRARNLGAREVQTRKVCFLDADTLVFPGIAEEIEGLLDLSTMVLAAQVEGYDIPNLMGFIALDICQFWGVGGYNESLEGYGAEDSYLRAKLFLERGLKPKRATKIGAIQHSLELRSQNHAESIHVSNARNYSALNRYLATQGVSDWHSDPKLSEITFRRRL